MRAQGAGIREIARQVGTLAVDDLERAAPQRGDPQWEARLPRLGRAVEGGSVRSTTEDREARGRRAAARVCAGAAFWPGSPARRDAVTGPETARWNGRNKPRRQDRRWVNAWSPEQISHRLKVDFPDDESMRISHEAIYQALYVQGRGALKRELVACLRTGRALRVPRARVWALEARASSPTEIMISERPAEAEDRAVPGHWEGDLILGTGHSAIGTLVERSSRFTMLLHLPPPADRQPRVKNGPPVSGHGAEAVRDAIAAAITHAARAAAPFADLGPRRRDDPAPKAQDRHRPARSTSVTPRAHGNAGPTRTPTGCCANTSPEAPTSPDTPPKTSPPSPPR